jgi:dipeptidyl aminopeptidase/acylaminoacyl peptidase
MNDGCPSEPLSPIGASPASEAPWRQRFRAPYIAFPLWARDAPDRLLYHSNASGKWELYCWDRTTETHRQATDRPAGTERAAIDPAGEWVWWFDDTLGNELGRWMVQPFGGGVPSPAAPDLPPAHPMGRALGRSFAVLGSSTSNGTTVHLVRKDEAPRLLYAHAAPARVVALSPDETALCLDHAERGDIRHLALRVLDLNGARAPVDLWDGPGRGLWAGDWSPVTGDQRLLVQHERGEVRRPLIWDVFSGEVQELRIDLPGEVQASWYPDGVALLLLHDYGGRSELYRFELPDEALQQLATEPGTVAAARVRPDGEVWYRWTCSSTPPQLHAGHRPLLLPAGAPAPAGVPYSDHHVGNVHVFLAEPIRPRPHPTVVLVHGGPHAHDRDAFSPIVQAWVDHGLAVALVNYRGSTGYGRAWRDALQGNPGLTELADLAAVHDWLIASGIAEPARVVLAGGSWGGYLTLFGLGVQPERWALGVAAVPVADFVAAYEDALEPWKAMDRALFGGSPEEVPEAYRLRSPITYVERVQVPVLILAAENDVRCPIRQIDNYVSRLRALGKPHQVYRYDAGHHLLVVEDTIHQLEVQFAFVARHLGTAAP